MSKTVDERVVSMQFDNKQFESNAKTTLTTLEKLKSALKIEGVSKGLDEASKSASNLGNSFKQTEAFATQAGFHFSDVWEKATRIVEYNIANRLVGAVRNLYKEFAIVPITTGFNEYELKMGSVQTIMASTGESLATVNKYLEELNKYSDDTIYSFSDMTNNIGKFTNAGVKLEDAVAAIKGVSNEAAISGANANEASRAMYNFSQALSAGYVKLIDWKSIENANMATVGFKEALLESAAAMGTVEKTADGMYRVITHSTTGSTMKETISATRNFNDSLSYQWMTTEVLTQTLSQYATDVRKMSDAEKQAYETKLKGLGYTDDQIKKIEELGIKATNAATEVKTFTMLMDTLKEAAQSGWAQTWELIIGDFNEAKSMLTYFSNFFGDIIAKSSDKRNSFLANVLESDYERFLKTLREAGVETDTFEESLKRVTDHIWNGRFDHAVEQYGSLENAIQAGAIKTYELEKALESLDTQMVDLSGISEELKKGVNGDDVTKIQKALKGLGYDLGQFGDGLDGIDGKYGKVTEAAVKAFQAANGLKETGIIDKETLDALDAAQTKTKSVTKNVKDLVKNLSKKGGRQLLIETITEALNTVKDILGAVGKAWTETFTGDASEVIYNIIAAINRFVKSLRPAQGTLNKITSVFKFLFSVIKTVITIIQSLISIVVKLATGGFKILIGVILDVVSAFGKITSKLAGFAKTAVTPIVTAVKKLADAFSDFSKKAKKAFDDFEKNVANKFKEIKESFKDNEIFNALIDSLLSVRDSITEFVNDISESFQNIDESVIAEKLNKVLNFFTNLGKTISENEIVVSIINSVSEALKNLASAIKNFKIKKPDFKLDDLANDAKKASQITDSIKTSFAKTNKTSKNSFFSGASSVVAGFAGYVKNIASFKWESLTSKTIEYWSKWYLEHGDGISNAVKKIKEVFASIIDFIFDTKKIKLSDIMDVSERILKLGMMFESFKILRSFSGIVENVTGTIENVGKAFKNLTKATKWKAVGEMLKSFAIAMTVLIVSLIVIDNLGPKRALKSAGVLVLLIGALSVLMLSMTALMSHIPNSVNGLFGAGALLGMILSLFFLIKALKNIDSMMGDMKHLEKSLGVLFSLLFGLVIAMAVLGKTCGSMSIGSAAAIITMLTGLKMVLEILEAYANFPWDTVEDAIPRLIEMLLMLAFSLRIASGGLKRGAKAGGLAFLMLSMMISLKIVMEAIAELGSMPEDQLKQGFIMAMGILIGLTACAVVMNKSVQPLKKGMSKVNVFRGMALALLAVCASVYILGNMPVDQLRQGLEAVVVVLSMFALVAYAFSRAGSKGLKTATMVAMIIGMGVVMAEMAIIMKQLESMDPSKMVAIAGSLIAVLLSMAFCMEMLTQHRNQPKTIVKWVLGMMGLGLVVAEIGAVIIAMKKFGVDGPSAVGYGVALSAVILSMAGVLTILTKHQNQAKTIWKWIGAMAGLGLVVAEMAVVIGLLNRFGGNPASSIANATALSIMINAMAGCLIILSKFPTKQLKNTKSIILAMAGLGLVVAEMAFILGLMNHFGGDIGHSIGNVVALSIMINAMAACLLILSKSTWPDSKSMFAAVGAMAVLGLVVGEVGIILTLLKDLDGAKAIPQVIALSLLLGAMTGCMVLCGIIGKVGIEAIAQGVLGLAMFATVLTAVIGILGIFGQMEAFQNALDAGIVVMEKLGQAIGAFIGGIAGGLVGGVMTAISSTLPQLGKDLSMFAANAMPFFAMIKTITVGDLAGIGILTLVIGALTAASLINGILNFYTIGHILPEFGKDLMGFMIGAGPFFAMLKTIDENALKSAQILADMLLTLTKAELLDAIAGFIGGGESDLSSFGDQLTEFGTCLVKFRDSVSDLSESDLTQIDLAATAGEKLSEMAKKIPRKGGIYDFLFGESTFDKFGANIVSFGISLLTYAATVTNFTDADLENVKRSAEAGTSLSTLAESIPNDGGVAAWLFGENNIATFGESITAFGGSIMAYAESVRGFSGADVTAIQNTASATEYLANAAELIPNDGGLAAWLFGENNIATFGESIASYGKSLMQYAESIRGLSESDVTAIGISKSATEKLAEIADVIPETDSGAFGKLFGQTNIREFGVGMTALAKAVKSYSEVARELKSEDQTNIMNSKRSIEAMASVSKAVPKLKGSFSSVSGDYVDNISTFAKGMSSMGKSVSEYSKQVSGLTDDDVVNIQRSGTAIGYLATAAKKLPNNGGFISKLTGDNSLSSFGTEMTAFAKSLVSYSRTISVLDDDATVKIKDSADATQAMATAAGYIFGDGGLVSLIAGDTSLSHFGDEMVSFGKSLTEYVIAIKDISESDITHVAATASVTEYMAEAATKIYNSGGVISWFTGDNSLDKFGKEMSSFSTNLVEYSKTVSKIDKSSLDSMSLAKDCTSILIDTASMFFNSVAGDADLSYASSNMNTFVSAIDQMSRLNAKGLTDTSTALEKLGSVNLKAFAESISKIGTDLNGAISELTVNMSTTIANSKPSMTTASNTALEGIIISVRSASPKVVSAISDLLSAATRAISSKKENFSNVTKLLMSSIVETIRSYSDKVADACKTVMTSGINAIRSKKEDFKQAGKYVTEGLVQGIKANEESAYNAGYALGQKAVEGEKAGQQSHSPSKATIQAGNWLGEGLIIGMEQMGSAVYNSGKTMGSYAVDSIRNALSSIGDTSKSDFGIEPHIRPVVDTSNIRMAKLDLSTSIDTYMSRPINSLSNIIADAQDRIDTSNRDMVNAINGLRDDMDSLYTMINEKDSNLYVDSRQLASSIAKPMNRELSVLARKGAY